jgi:hypothetical protein
VRRIEEEPLTLDATFADRVNAARRRAFIKVAFPFGRASDPDGEFFHYWLNTVENNNYVEGDTADAVIRTVETFVNKTVERKCRRIKRSITEEYHSLVTTGEVSRAIPQTNSDQTGLFATLAGLEQRDGVLVTLSGEYIKAGESWKFSHERRAIG